MKVVADSSPLIILARVGCFDRIAKTYERVFISEQVYGEIVVGGARLPGAAEVTKADWIEVRKLRQPDLLAPSQSETHLGIGELSTLALARENCRGRSPPGRPEGPQAGNRVRLCGARHRRPPGIVLSARRYRRPSSSVRSVAREWRLHRFGATELSPRSPRAGASVALCKRSIIVSLMLLACSLAHNIPLIV